ncbi:hypothetical protein ACVW0P_000432 [Mucilaginibacter sp. UYNi724]
MRKLIATLTIIAFIFCGCKKDRPEDTAITINALTGRWQVVPISNTYYGNNDQAQVQPLDVSKHYEYELSADGKVTEYYIEGNYTSTGQFSLSKEVGQDYLTIGISGHSGDLYMGKAEIKRIDNNTYQLSFTSFFVGKTIFVEQLKRK